MYSGRVTCRLEVNRKRCGDDAELSYVGLWGMQE